MIQRIRRYVTGHDSQGRSNVTFADHAPNATELAGWPGAGVTEIWVTGEMPVDNNGGEDRSLRPLRHDPTPMGTIFRIVEIPPENRGGGEMNAEKAFEQLGSRNRPSAEDRERHPTMHKTDSIDYLVVLKGEMTMLMENGEAHLKPGDCIVQRGTNHAWINKGTESVLLAAVLIDAKPVR
jgi:mannose-6-phosphate isomerase-like protein (cupin superfamily)